MNMHDKTVWIFASVCLVLGLSAQAQAEVEHAPNAHFLFGSNIFESGQSNNIGPAALTVIEEGMYWFEGDCSGADGSRRDCDLLRFGASVYPKMCSDQTPARVARVVDAGEDGGEDVQAELKTIQNGSSTPYCDTELDYQPLDEALFDHQADIFQGTRSGDDSPWRRPNLNLLVLDDVPQTDDATRGDDGRAYAGIESTCRLFHGEADWTRSEVPSMPSWVMMARRHATDAATYGGLLAAAGGTGECCYDEHGDCDPSDPNEQLDVCGELSRFDEDDIRQGVADGHFQCEPGSSDVQTGAMDFGDDDKGTLPHILCHFAGEDGHANCSDSESGNAKRRATNVLEKMSCIRQVSDEYDGGPLEVCDRHDDCETFEVCDDASNEDCELEFIDPNETLVAVRGADDDGNGLCEMLGDGGYVREPRCPNEGDRCTVDELSDGSEAHGRCSVGQIACDDNGNEYCEQLYEPMPEICNGLDDDCDGQVDNLSTSWDDFEGEYDPTDLASYDDDGVDRSGVHCYEHDICRCADGPMEHAGPGFDEHVTNWEPGQCECGEGLSEVETPADDGATDETSSVDGRAGCSSASQGAPSWLVAFLIAGVWSLGRKWGLWRLVRRALQ